MVSAPVPPASVSLELDPVSVSPPLFPRKSAGMKRQSMHEGSGAPLLKVSWSAPPFPFATTSSSVSGSGAPSGKVPTVHVTLVGTVSLQAGTSSTAIAEGLAKVTE